MGAGEDQITKCQKRAFSQICKQGRVMIKFAKHTTKITYIVFVNVFTLLTSDILSLI